MSRSEEMRSVFVRWEESGLSLRSFGKQEKISYGQLQYWRRKLRREEAETSGAPRRRDPSGWAPIRVIGGLIPQDTGAEGFEVRLANGLGVRVSRGFDEDELRRLVLVLASC
jgi:hypothetical protein